MARLSKPRASSRRLATLTVGFTLVAALVVPNAPAAHADPPADCATKPLSWVTMGDSYTNGEGSGNGVYVRLPNGQEDFRHRSGYSQVHLAWLYLLMGRHPGSGSWNVSSDVIIDQWMGDRFIFNPSTGAKSQHVDEDQVDFALNNPRQLNGIDPNATLAWFGFGGNDFGFADMLQTAYMSYLRSKYLPFQPVNWQQTQARRVRQEINRLLLRQVIAQIAVETYLTQAMLEMRQAEFVVGLYPIPVKKAGNTGIREIGGAALDEMYRFGEQVNATVRTAVANVQSVMPNRKIRIFDPNTAGPGGTSLFAGHELGSAQPYVNGIKQRVNVMSRGTRWVFRGMQESFHPNQFGDVVLGKALAAFMAREFKTCFPNGPDYGAAITNPVDLAVEPTDADLYDQWAWTNRFDLCDGADIASLCNWFHPVGILYPIDLVMPDIHLELPPEIGRPVASYDGGGATPGSPGGWSWTPGTYNTGPPWIFICDEPYPDPDDPGLPPIPNPNYPCGCNDLRLVAPAPGGPRDVTEYVVGIHC